MAEWYYNLAQTPLGPVSWDELRQMAAAGQFTDESLVWTEGMEQWMRADDVADLFTLMGAAASARPVIPLAYATPSVRAKASGVPIYAGFWQRTVAYIIDGVILAIAGAIIGGLMDAFGVVHPARTYNVFLSIHMDPKGLLETLVAWAYFSVQESSRFQATLGKRACGISVVSLDGRRLGYGRATARYFAKIISDLTCGIGYLMAGMTADNQALHDKIAGTLVLKGVHNPQEAERWARRLTRMSEGRE